MHSSLPSVYFFMDLDEARGDETLNSWRDSSPLPSESHRWGPPSRRFLRAQDSGMDGCGRVFESSHLGFSQGLKREV